MPNEDDLHWLHARRDRLELLAIEVELRLESCQRRLEPIERQCHHRQLSEIERRELDTWIDEQSRLRKYAARIAQERPQIESRISVATARHAPPITDL